MPDAMKLGFDRIEPPARGILILLLEEGGNLGSAASEVVGPAADLIARARESERFTGKNGAVLELIAPSGLAASRLIILGVGKEDGKPRDFARLGGAAIGKVPASATDVTIVLDLPSGVSPEQAAEFALGATLRAYSFDRYKTKRPEGDERADKVRVTLGVADPAAARKAWSRREGLARGVVTARDLVNEPPNVLYPEEFARRAEKLREVGIEVEILDVKAMRKLGMHALLGVGQGSVRESRMAIMRWNGGPRDQAPVAFIGKGVCFDTGGISIKPAASMEDMKGDMAGAACVVGLMHALASRKAAANVVGAIGLVENMPGGGAQRPGDIVTSMSGQTIEIINTDAEGRLVLADVLHYVNTRFKPQFMVNLATLTGAIIVALGQEYAGLFCNDDTLAERLFASGESTSERVWRMPLRPEYDKMIDSKFADVKNTGGRNASAITAAQFLQRFVDKTPWAHLDIAGTAMGSPSSDINRSWGSGWGVRLLDHLVAQHYESAGDGKAGKGSAPRQSSAKRRPKGS